MIDWDICPKCNQRMLPTITKGTTMRACQTVGCGYIEAIFEIEITKGKEHTVIEYKD
jgi:DNA-directed RNA polymerase subunit M/transcription elongation factor TFIIS